MVSHDYYLNFRVIRYIFAFYSVVRIQEIIFIYSPYTPLPHYPTTPMTAKNFIKRGTTSSKMKNGQ